MSYLRLAKECVWSNELSCSQPHRRWSLHRSPHGHKGQLPAEEHSIKCYNPNNRPRACRLRRLPHNLWYKCVCQTYTIIYMSICTYIYNYMGIVWLRALCSVWELVIEIIEVVHVCKKLCTFHRSCARFTRPPNNVRVELLWNGALIGALNQTIPNCVYIYTHICTYFI